jgi:hypothetical protein
VVAGTLKGFPSADRLDPVERIGAYQGLSSYFASHDSSAAELRAATGILRDVAEAMQTFAPSAPLLAEGGGRLSGNHWNPDDSLNGSAGFLMASPRLAGAGGPKLGPRGGPCAGAACALPLAILAIEVIVELVKQQSGNDDKAQPQFMAMEGDDASSPAIPDDTENDYDPYSPERDTSGDRLLKRSEENLLKENGRNPEQIKEEILGGQKRTGRYDVFVDKQGNLFVKPKNAYDAPGEFTGYNLNGFK